MVETTTAPLGAAGIRPAWCPRHDVGLVVQRQPDQRLRTSLCSHPDNRPKSLFCQRCRGRTQEPDTSGGPARDTRGEPERKKGLARVAPRGRPQEDHVPDVTGTRLTGGATGYSGGLPEEYRVPGEGDAVPPRPSWQDDNHTTTIVKNMLVGFFVVTLAVKSISAHGALPRWYRPGGAAPTPAAAPGWPRTPHTCPGGVAGPASPTRDRGPGGSARCGGGAITIAIGKSIPEVPAHRQHDHLPGEPEALRNSPPRFAHSSSQGRPIHKTSRLVILRTCDFTMRPLPVRLGSEQVRRTN